MKKNVYYRYEARYSKLLQSQERRVGNIAVSAGHYSRYFAKPACGATASRWCRGRRCDSKSSGALARNVRIPILLRLDFILGLHRPKNNKQKEIRFPLIFKEAA